MGSAGTLTGQRLSSASAQMADSGSWELAAQLRCVTSTLIVEALHSLQQAGPMRLLWSYNNVTL